MSSPRRGVGQLRQRRTGRCRVGLLIGRRRMDARARGGQIGERLGNAVRRCRVVREFLGAGVLVPARLLAGALLGGGVEQCLRAVGDGLGLGLGAFSFTRRARLGDGRRGRANSGAARPWLARTQGRQLGLATGDHPLDRLGSQPVVLRGAVGVLRQELSSEHLEPTEDAQLVVRRGGVAVRAEHRPDLVPRRQRAHTGAQRRRDPVGATKVRHGEGHPATDDRFGRRRRRSRRPPDPPCRPVGELIAGQPACELIPTRRRPDATALGGRRPRCSQQLAHLGAPVAVGLRLIVGATAAWSYPSVGHARRGGDATSSRGEVPGCDARSSTAVLHDQCPNARAGRPAALPPLGGFTFAVELRQLGPIDRSASVRTVARSRHVHRSVDVEISRSINCSVDVAGEAVPAR